MKAENYPVVLHPVSLPDFLRYVLDNHAPPTKLIVCSSRHAFLDELLHSLRASDNHRQNSAGGITAGAQHDGDSGTHNLVPDTAPSHPLLIPTLHLIATSGTVKLAFCSDLSALQAYLSVHGIRPSDSTSATPDTTPGHQPLLALLNPLALHKNTSFFSAQGLSRTFASAVEAAARTGQKLVIAECPPPTNTSTGSAGDEDGGDSQELEGESMDVSMDVQISQDDGTGDPWEQQVAILNVTTRSFGIGERGWAGRTVKARRVVERWCRFERGGISGEERDVKMEEDAG